MTQPSPKENKVIIVPPPRLFASPLSNKYDLILRVVWGENEKEIKVSREQGNFFHSFVETLNQALGELSEANPYLLK